LSLNALRRIGIDLPTLPEQRAIAKVLKTADDEIAKLKAKEAQIAEQRKYLLNNLVTGKIKLGKD
jgi:type I restriction enzyme S subunit